MSSLFVLFFWTVPKKTELFIINLSITIGFLQKLMIVAMSWAFANKVAHFTYCEIPSAILVGFLLFQTLPDLFSWVGMVPIIFNDMLVKLFINKS